MNDEQTSDSKEETNAQKVDEVISLTRAQFEGLAAAAAASNEKTKASESDAAHTLSKIKEILASVEATSKKITEAEPKFAAAASEVEANRSAVATHAQQIDEAQKRATDIRAELDGVLAKVKQTQGDIDGLKQNAEGAKDAASQANTEAQTAKTSVDANAKAVADALKESKVASATTKGLADKVETVEQRIQDYEAKLDGLTVQCDKQLEEIKHLLPGATAAGLASAFDARRKTFMEPSKRWQVMFVTSVIILAIGALISLLEVYQHAPTMGYQQLLVLWLSRLPFAAALVWLAMHASRESALAKRLEEDYGFKVSVASSFQGFQEQMKRLGDSANANEPLKTLCEATLAQITTPPGRIYDKHALIVSPTIEMLRLAKAMVDAAKAAKIPINGG